MAFDGIVLANVKRDIEKNILGGRVDKIYLPERDAVVMSVRSSGQYKLLLSANPSQPRINFTKLSYENPMKPPLFCMVLRKHLSSGKIVGVEQPNFERILIIKIESANEMGDYSVKKLIIEIMGRHSNIILTDENDVILDSARHVSFDTSSVRQVLPGKKYEFPPNKDKRDPLAAHEGEFLKCMGDKAAEKIQTAIYTSFSGISPSAADAVCFSAGLDGSSRFEELDDDDRIRLFSAFSAMVQRIKEGGFVPTVYISLKKGKPTEYSSLPLPQLKADNSEKHYTDISDLLEEYYGEREKRYRIEQKTKDLKKLIMQNIERCAKKKDIYKKTFKETADREKYKLYGELVTANIYSIKKGMTTFETVNFYDEAGGSVEIPLDGDLTPAENAQKYFKRYAKEKRTFEALTQQVKTNDEEMRYLESVLSMLTACENEQDITEIRRELYEQGFIKHFTKEKKGASRNKKSKPLSFVSSDGFKIYVGKNNYQNDELTIKTAKPWDIWFHTKNIPGSHVIVVTEGREVPDTTLNEAALLAAFYSKGKESALVPVDYTQRRNVKKPNGAKPGMVIYETNKTAYMTPSEEAVSKIKTAEK